METFLEPARTIPVRERVDVLVVGCGTAGFAAAVAAGRSGVRTMALDANGYPGGTFTGGLVWRVDGLHGIRPGTGEKTYPVRGLLSELAARVEARGGLDGWRFDVEINKLVMIEMMEGAGVEILFHCLFVDVIREGDRVAGVIVESKSGREAVLAKVVVDCTGDADVAFRAGVECAHSSHWAGPAVDYVTDATEEVERWRRAHDRETSDFFWEMLGPLQQLPRELSYFAVPSFGCPSRRVCRNTLGEGYQLWTVEGLTRAEIDGRKRIFEFLDQWRERFPILRETHPVLFAQMLGVRETRRVRGEYVLSFEDVKSFRRFPDVVTLSPVFWAYAFLFQIPYRCLLPVGVEGLLVAGRCISDTRIVHDGARIISTCVGLGEAAGVAAGLAVREGTGVKRVPVARLQEQIRDRGGELDLFFEPGEYTEEEIQAFLLHQKRLESYGYRDAW